jgi:hypothetical protein
MTLRPLNLNQALASDRLEARSPERAANPAETLDLLSQLTSFSLTICCSGERNGFCDSRTLKRSVREMLVLGAELVVPGFAPKLFKLAYF